METDEEETDAVKMIAEERTPMVLTAKEVERASEEDPELSSVGHNIQSGDWSQCKMPHFKRQAAKIKLLSSAFSSLYSRIKIFVFAVNSKRHFSI